MNNKIITKAVVILLLLCITLMGCSKPQTSEISDISTTESTTISTTNEDITTSENKQTEATSQDEKSTSNADESTSTTSAKSTSSTDEKTSVKNGKDVTTAPGEYSTTRPTIPSDENELPSINKSSICTINIECKDILKHKKNLASGHENFVPDDGYILSNYEYKIGKKATIYDVLKQVCKDNNIILTSRNSEYGSYIVGINNLDEKDCGQYSGWLYYVNGKMPNYACDKYEVKKGDIITFSYSCEPK